MRQSPVGYFMLPLVLAAGCAHRQAPPDDSRTLSVEELAERTRPATVVILNQVEISGSFPVMEINTSLLVDDVRNLVGPNAGDEETADKYYQTFLHDLTKYMKQTGSRQLNAKIESLGTGFFITPDGYLITNDHVVKLSHEVIIEEMLGSNQLGQRAIDALQRGLNELVPGISTEAEMASRVRQAIARQYVTAAELHDSSKIAALMPTTDEAKGGIDARECRVEKEGSPYPGKDIAILKVDGDDLPTLPLEEGVANGSLRIGASLVVMGFPGKVMRDADFTMQSRIVPSLSSGRVSSIQEEEKQGWYVIQTDATINHGNSGGPVLDDSGKVVGVATFSEEESTGLNFAIDIDVARQFLSDLNVTPRESDFTTTYGRALDAYESHNRVRALELFRALASSHPESVPVRNFVSQLNGSPASTQAIAPSSTSDQPAPSPIRHTNRGILILFFFGGLVALVSIVAIASRR